MSRPQEELQHPLPSKAARVLCSIGGEILWSGNKKCYVYSGGETRIWSLSRDITFLELMSKLSGFYHTTSSLKYQLPDLDLDTLVSVSGDDDIDRMMEEYDVAEGSGQRLRLFLFPMGDLVEWRERRQKERALGSREASPRGTLSRPDSLQDLHSPHSKSSHSSQLTSPKSLPDLHLHYPLPPIATPRPISSSPRRVDRNSTHKLSPRAGRQVTSQSAVSSPGSIDWSLTGALSPQKDKSGRVITSRSAASSPGLVDWSFLTGLPLRNELAAQDRSATSSPGLIDWSSSPPPERQFNPLPFPISPSPIHTGQM